MKNLRHSIIKMSMESISDIIIDHQTLASQLASVDEVNGELIVDHSVVVTSAAGGDGSNIDESNLEAHQGNSTTPCPSPLPVAVVVAGVGVVDVDVDDVANSVVTTSSVDGSTITTDIDGGSVMMVRTIIDGLSHSPVQSSYQAPTPLQHQQQHNSHQSQQHQQQIQQQQHHNHHRHHQHQLQHQLHQQRLSSSSPVDFVGSAVTLESLSVGGGGTNSPTSCSTRAANLIAVKQEHKLVIVNHDNSNNINNTSISNSTHNNSNNNRLDVSSVVSVMDELSSEAVEVTLNQHHHQHVQHQQQHYNQQHQQHTHHQHSSNHNHHHHNSSNNNNSNNSNNIHQQQNLLGISTHHVRSQYHNQHQHHNSHHSHHTSHIDHRPHHEALSVIVQPHEDDDESRDSATQMLSPPDLCGVVVGASANGGVISDSSLEPTTYQTLTSVVNERMSSSSPPLPGFSPNSSYATLTPLQPLPPISTMSDKFAYGGHISGGGVGGTVGGGTGSNSNSNSDAACGVSGSSVGGVSFMPHQSSCLSALSLSSLSGVQSPYSAYDKLPSMGMSMSPPPHHHTHYSNSSPSGLVVACDLHHHHHHHHHHPTSPTSPCGGALSPQSAYSHTTELQSPTLSASVAVCIGSGKNNSSNHQQQQHHHTSAANKLQQVVCMSPVDGSEGILGDNTGGGGIVVTGYDSPYSVTQQQRDLLVNTTPSSTRSGGGRNSQLQLQHSPILSPHSHSISAGSVSLHSPGIVINHQSALVAMPPINGAMATLSAASLINATVELTHLQRDAVVVSLTPSPPPSSSSQHNDISTSTASLLAIHQPQQQQQQQLQEHQEQLQQSSLLGKLHPVASDCSLNSSLSLNSNGLRLSHITASTSNSSNNNTNICSISHQQNQQQQQQNELQQRQQQLQTSVSHVGSAAAIANNSTAATSTSTNSAGTSSNLTSGGSGSGDVEEINTKELAQRISAELKRYSIPQAIFAQRVLCRSQGTLSDLLRNPKPWSKLKSGRETFRRMFKWLQEPEFQRMSALRMAAAQIPQRGSNGGNSGGNGSVGSIGVIGNVVGSGIVGSAVGGTGHNSVASSTGVGTVVDLKPRPPPHSSLVGGGTGMGVSNNGVVICRRKDEPHIEHMPQPKKPRLVFTDLQRRTLQAIFKETKRPSKEMQVTIARQLGLEPTTVGNFFMNARRRSMDKWRDDDSKNMGNHLGSTSDHLNNNKYSNNNNNHHHHQNHHHQSSLSPGNQHSLDLDDDAEMDLDLGHDDFDLDGDHEEDHDNDDML